MVENGGEEKQSGEGIHLSKKRYWAGERKTKTKVWLAKERVMRQTIEKGNSRCHLAKTTRWQNQGAT